MQGMCGSGDEQYAGVSVVQDEDCDGGKVAEDLQVLRGIDLFLVMSE